MRDGITLYFVRHGETDWNAERRYQGQRDIPLNAKGREQARRNGQTLATAAATLFAAKFVASPLGRARETMEILRAEMGLPVSDYTLEDRLKELSYGTWEGQLQDELPQVDPGSWSARSLDPYRWRPHGGESYADLLKRSAGWLASVEHDTVVASHGGVSRCLRGHVLGLDPASIPELESPQDRVLVLTSRGMSWL
ncbi:MAG: histidine phosphatase family protein [Hyphomicrobium sp.]